MTVFVILKFEDDDKCKAFIETTRRDETIYYHMEDLTFDSARVKVTGSTLEDYDWGGNDGKVRST